MINTQLLVAQTNHLLNRLFRIPNGSNCNRSYTSTSPRNVCQRHFCRAADAIAVDILVPSNRGIDAWALSHSFPGLPGSIPLFWLHWAGSLAAEGVAFGGSWLPQFDKVGVIEWTQDSRGPGCVVYGTHWHYLSWTMYKQGGFGESVG